MTRWHIETEYRAAPGLLANVSAYPSRESAWEYARRELTRVERLVADILLTSLTDTDNSDEDPLSRIATLESFENTLVRHVRPCDGRDDCTACYEAGLID